MGDLKEIDDSYKELKQGAILEVQDEGQLAEKYLSDKAKLALSKKSTTQVVQVPGTMEGFS